MLEKIRLSFDSYIYSKNNIFLFLIAFLVLFVSAYSSVLTHEFKWDEILYIYFNSELNPEVAATSPVKFPEEAVYRPVRQILFKFLSYIFPIKPIVFRILVLIMATINILLVFLLSLKLTGDKLISFFSAYFFGLTASNFAVYATILGIDDIFVVTFSLAGILSYIRYSDNDRLRWLILTLLLFCGAVLSKETGFVVVFFPLIYDLVFKGFIKIRIRKFLYFLFAIPLILYFSLKLFTGDMTFWTYVGENLKKYNILLILATWLKAMCIYFYRAIISDGPELYYFIDFYSFRDLMFYFFIVVGIVAIILFYKLRKKNNFFTFVLIILFITSIPLSNLLRIPQSFVHNEFVMGGRFFYLSSVFFSMVLAILVCGIFRLSLKKKNIIVPIVLGLLILSNTIFLTIKCLWLSNQISTFKKTIEYVRAFVEKDENVIRRNCNISIIEDMHVLDSVYNNDMDKAVSHFAMANKLKQQYCTKMRIVDEINPDSL